MAKRKNTANRLANAGHVQLGSETRQLVQCWAMHEDFLDRLSGALGSDETFSRFDGAVEAFDETMKRLIGESVMRQVMETDFTAM